MDFPQHAVKFLLKNDDNNISEEFLMITSAIARRRFGDKTMSEAFVKIDDSLKIMNLSLRLIVSTGVTPIAIIMIYAP